MKNNISTQQLHSAMQNNNRATMKPTMKEKNDKTTIVQQPYNNRSTMRKQ